MTLVTERYNIKNINDCSEILGIFKNVGLDAAIINKSVTVQGDEK
jgi:hypothetical protein